MADNAGRQTNGGEGIVKKGDIKLIAAALGVSISTVYRRAKGLDLDLIKNKTRCTKTLDFETGMTGAEEHAARLAHVIKSLRKGSNQ